MLPSKERLDQLFELQLLRKLQDARHTLEYYCDRNSCDDTESLYVYAMELEYKLEMLLNR